MALKDTWQDKIDGVDIIYAKDINDIAKGVIALEEAEENKTNIELAETLAGNETDKAPSVKAANDGLAATRKYVNDEDAKLSNRISELEDTIGAILTTETINFNVPWTRDYEVPIGSLPNFYIDTVTATVDEYDNMTGLTVATHTIKPSYIIYCGAAMEELERRSFEAPCYDTMPVETYYITFNWDEAIADVAGSAFAVMAYNVAMTFQILKVGG